MHPAVHRKHRGEDRAMRGGADRAGFAVYDASLHAVRSHPRHHGRMRSAAQNPRGGSVKRPVTRRRYFCRFHGIRCCTWPARPSSIRRFFCRNRRGVARCFRRRRCSFWWRRRCGRRMRRGGHGDDHGW